LVAEVAEVLTTVVAIVTAVLAVAVADQFITLARTQTDREVDIEVRAVDNL
jgi:hypothetical protein